MIALSMIQTIADETDRAFMERLYSAYRAPMYRKALSIVRNHHDAEDAVEAAVLRLIDKIELLRGCGRVSLRSYVLSAAKNAAIDLLRRSNRAPMYTFDDAEARMNAIPDRIEADDELLRAADVAAMADALSRLPDRERELLRMKYYEELDDAEIGRILGLGRDSVRPCLTRARRRLRAVLKEVDSHAQ